MDEIERHLLIEVIQGKREYSYLAFHISKHVRGGEICQWLIKNRIVGDKLWSVFKGEFNGSVLNLISYVISKIENDAMRSIIGGKDYI